MKKFLRVVIPFLIVFSVSSPGNIAVAEETNDTTNIIVKYKNDEKPDTTNSFQTIKEETEAALVEVPTAEVKEAMEKLEKDPNVDYVEKEIQYKFFGSVNDSYYNSYQYSDFSLIQAPEAWDLFAPKQTPIVAVLDSGIDMNHPDLKNLLYRPYNAMYPGTSPYDDVGHGTHVAGTVGAQTNNGEGVASLSKGVLIMPVKVGDNYGISTFDIASGIYYAVDNGASIINLSIGGGYSQYVEDAVNYAYQRNVLVIAAAGNEGTSSTYGSYPAALENVVAVSAVDSTDNGLAYFSNYGEWVDIAAPGVDIFSTYPNQTYRFMSGTSMASPMVASLAALLKNHEPILTGNQIRWMMEYSGDSYYGSFDYNDRINAYQTLDTFNRYSRISGATSVETSNEIAYTGWGDELVQYNYLKPYEELLNEDILKSDGNFAILASNQSFPDSLAAGALSYKLDAPVLLTYPNNLKQETIDTLNQLNVNKVLILGGPAAVSENVANGLRNNGMDAIRLKGTDRFSTATEINDYIAKKGETVIIANGRNFPDALSVSSFSASGQIPIVFVEKDTIPQSTLDFLNKYDFSNSIVIGGTGAISNNVLQQLPNPVRISGKDRFETNTKVIDHFVGENDIDGFLFATGRNFPDALAGGPLSAKMNYPLVLVDSGNVPANTKAYVEQKVDDEYASFGDYSDMYTLGGKGAVIPKLVWELDSIIYKYYYLNVHNPDFYNFNSDKVKQPLTEVTSKTTKFSTN